MRVKEMVYAGIDIHKEYCHTVVCTKEGSILHEKKIKNTQEELNEFFCRYLNMKVAVESTTLSYPIIEILEELGHEVYVAHPLKTKVIAEAKIKTDKIDAKMLVHMLRTKLLPTSYIPNKEIRIIRGILQQRIFYGKLSGKLKNRIYAELMKRGIKYDNIALFTKKGREWLGKLKIENIDSTIKILENVESEIAKLNSKIEDIGKRYDEVRLLSTIPGIGIYSALLIHSIIGQIDRFPTEKKFCSYIGLVPSVHQSGQNAYYGKITKQGSNVLRWILTEASWTHIRYAPNSKLTKYYYKLIKKKPKQVAIVATARKLAQVIYCMLINKEKYRG